MSNSWDLKTEDSRSANSKPTFIIYCEDEVSEPVYFKFFETSKIKVNLIPKQNSKMDHVLKAITDCKSKNHIQENENGNWITGDGAQIWCVFDRDKEETEAKRLKGDTSFNESIRTANANEIKVAWSNDAFELWILLHFEEVDLANKDYQSRVKYYERLTEIFRTLSNPNDDLIKVLRYHDYSYKNNLKSENNFRSIVRKEIVGNTRIAIERANQLEIEQGKVSNPSGKAPCTLVHHLVEELIQQGGKI